MAYARISAPGFGTCHALYPVGFFRAEQARQMPAGRIAHNGIFFRLHIKLLRMIRDVPHRIAQILQRGMSLRSSQMLYRSTNTA